MTTSIKYTATKMIVIRDGATEIKDRDAYISRRGLVHVENCAVLTKMVTSMNHPSQKIATEAAYAAIESGKLGTCSACMKIAAKRAAEFAAVEAEYLAEPVAEVAPKTTSTAAKLTALLEAEPTRWFRPRDVERLWGLKNDKNIRNTARKMANVQISTDDKGAMVFALAA